MNFKFLIFLIIISFIYIWLSNTIMIYWNVYKKYIQFGLILFTCILFYQKPDILSKIINKIIKIVNLEIFKVKTWFWNKDLSSLDSIN